MSEREGERALVITFVAQTCEICYGTPDVPRYFFTMVVVVVDVVVVTVQSLLCMNRRVNVWVY